MLFLTFTANSYSSGCYRIRLTVLCDTTACILELLQSGQSALSSEQFR